MLDPKVQICLLDASNILFIYILALIYSQLLQGKFVAEAMCIIAANTNVPVSVKCRIGINEHVHTVNYVRFSNFPFLSGNEHQKSILR